MYSRIENVGDKIHVHLAEASRSAVSGFLRGGIRFDPSAGVVTFGSLPPVGIPPDLVLEEGKEIFLQLVGPDGELRNQTRTGTLYKAKTTSLYRIKGQNTTTPRFSREAGWTNQVYQYRAYLTHPGLSTTGFLPDWLRESIDRQRKLWNHLAWLCREARRKCSPVPSEEIKAFVDKSAIAVFGSTFNGSVAAATGSQSHYFIQHQNRLSA